MNRRGGKRYVMTVAYLFDPAHALDDLRWRDLVVVCWARLPRSSSQDAGIEDARRDYRDILSLQLRKGVSKRRVIEKRVSAGDQRTVE